MKVVLTKCVKAYVCRSLQINCTAWLTWTVAGGTLLNLYSRYRLPKVVHAESLLQIRWAC